MTRRTKSSTLIDDEPPPKDPMTVDYRTRCMVQRTTHDVIIYGHTCLDYDTQHPDGGGVITARDLDDDFNHSAGKGLLPGRRVLEPVVKHFFTPGIGRKEEILLMRKLRRL